MYLFPLKWDLGYGKTLTTTSEAQFAPTLIGRPENNTRRRSLWSCQIPAAFTLPGEETEAEGRKGSPAV